MKYLGLLLLTLVAASCAKEKDPAPVPAPPLFPYMEVDYKVIITLRWQSPSFTVPASAHFTPFIGMIHSGDTTLWSSGKLASKGLEDVAEVGNNTAMNLELDAIINSRKAMMKFAIPLTAITGNFIDTVTFSSLHSNFSAATMIAPSPDWFAGINSCDLLKSNQWVADTTVNLSLYDAGTEEGNVFDYDNPATMPQRTIMPLTTLNASVLANGNMSVVPIGSVQFIKLN